MNPLTSTTEISRTPAEMIKRALAFHSADLHEAAGGVGALPSGLKPVSPQFLVCGPAVTVVSPPKDNLWLHRALYAAKPGDVLVVDTGGYYEAGYWGEIMSHAAKEAGLAGMVIDGCVRDGLDIIEIGFPIWSRGLCIRGTSKDKNAVGAYNVPVRIGEITVFPGDLVMGDADGVVVIEQSTVEDVLVKTQARVDKEAETIRQIHDGIRTVDLYGFNE
ncbi:MAG: 4-hydroxy-4-methyl-2-oxoglutarate aldolase [Chloroflexi bacterium]|jgi:4-hydroxy-4-methyl-2-oxoglutarate aldolase|nr:MAG: 4-hydroxy-4-methyl-2-oxoglutarate aldolase [Chloroflexota bacterium]